MSRIQNVHPKVYKGIKYKSTLEAETAEVLDKLGFPIRYEERRIVLLESFKCPFQKNKVRGITYEPDFLVGNIILECKGFETPEWRNKKKYIFKYLMENEPETIFYQTHNSKKDLLLALDNHWNNLGLHLKVKSKENKKAPSQIHYFDSIQEALHNLNLKGKAIGPILKSLTGEKEYVYGYNWKLERYEYN